MAEELYPGRLSFAWRDPASRASLLLVQHGHCIAETQAAPGHEAAARFLLRAEGRNVAFLRPAGGYRLTVSQAPCRLLRLMLPLGSRYPASGSWAVDLGLLLPMLRLLEQALRHPGGEERRGELGTTLLGYVLHQLRQAGCVVELPNPRDAVALSESLEGDVLTPLRRWLHGHLSQPLQLPDLARAMALSPRRLQELCREQAGCSPMELLREVRLDALAEQLQNPMHRQQSVATLMRQLGLADSVATRRDFHARFGCSPSDYRQSQLAHQ